MSLIFDCPNTACRKKCLVPEELQGKRVMCPHCREPMTVPEAMLISTAPPSGSTRETPIPPPPTLDLPHPTQIGRFSIQAKLGSGTFGTVYLAHDPQLDRQMALKVPNPITLSYPEAVERFLREARSAAQLHHAHIVPVYEASASEGTYYIVSAYIRGRTLADIIAGRPLESQRAARIAMALAEALAYAHRKGILHRDVKPSNVILDEQDEPHLTDFGLAFRLYASSRHLTQTGVLLGTPAYMSPEQASGKSGEPVPASDQYSLGVVLYEMLTGRLPFEGPTEVVLYHTLNSVPDSPRSLQPKLSAVLEQICLKTLAKKPADRFADCQALADALRNVVQENKQLLPIPESPPVRIPVPRGRKPLLLTGVILLSLLTVAAAGAAWWFRTEARNTQSEAEQARAELNDQATIAKQLEGQLQQARYERAIDQSSEGWLSNQPLLAEAALEKAPEALRDWEWRYLKNLGRYPVTTLVGHTAGVASVAFDAEGKRVASGSFDRTVRVWDARTGKELFKLEGHSGTVRALAFSPDGKRLVSAVGQVEPPFVPPANAPQVMPAPVRPAVRRVVPPQDHAWVSLQAKDEKKAETPPADQPLRFDESGEVIVWDLVSGKQICTLRGASPMVQSIAFSRDGKRLVTTGSQGLVDLWDADTYKKELRWQTPFALVDHATFSPDGEAIAFASNSSVYLGQWLDKQPKEVANLTSTVLSLRFNPLGTVLSAVEARGLVKTVWRQEKERKPALAPGDLLTLLQPPAAPPIQVPLAETFWGNASATLTPIPSGPTALVAAALASDGQRIAASWGVGFDAAVLSLSAGVTGQTLQPLRGHTAPVVALALSSDNRWLASAGLDHTVKIWNATRWLDLPLLGVPYAYVRGVSFTPECQRIAVVGSTRRIEGPEDSLQVWDQTNGLQFTRLGTYHAVALAPDGKRVAIAGGQPAMMAPREFPRKETRRPEVPRAPLPEPETAFVFVDHSAPPTEAPAPTSPQVSPTPVLGDKGADQSFVMLVDATTGREIRSFRDLGLRIDRLLFSPDGRRLAGLSQAMFVTEMRTEQIRDREGRLISRAVPVVRLVGGELTVWEVSTGRQLINLPKQALVSSAMAFSPDGERLAYTVGFSDDTPEQQTALPRVIGELKVIEVATGKELQVWACKNGPPSAITWSQDGKRLAWSQDSQIHVCDPASGVILKTMGVPFGFVNQLTFSRDGKRLVSASADLNREMGEILIWDATTGEELALIDPVRSAGLTLQFDTEGRRLLYSGIGPTGNLEIRSWNGGVLATPTSLPAKPDTLPPFFSMPQRLVDPAPLRNEKKMEEKSS